MPANYDQPAASTSYTYAAEQLTNVGPKYDEPGLTYDGEWALALGGDGSGQGGLAR